MPHPIWLLATLGLTTVSPSFDAAEVISRTEYGVPVIRAKSFREAMVAMGFAVAQDRMWQLENSRRMARGKMAAAFGPKFVASDKATLSQAYTDQELNNQFQGLSNRLKLAFEAYAEGVNLYLDRASTEGNLPPEYAENGLKPEPWSITDSLAITVRLMQQFGRGGAGELRNWTLYEYMKTQPKLKDRTYEALEDFLWQNDKEAICTVADSDDPVKTKPFFPNPTAKSFSDQYNRLPKLSLLDLLPAATAYDRPAQRAVAQSVAAPFQSGSYCVVVHPSRSKTAKPFLLSGPQMGFTNPSIVHEASLHWPGGDVAGMDVPGVPGVLVGATPDLAWGVTTGVADVEDVYAVKLDESGKYQWKGESIKPEKTTLPILVKGGEDSEGVRLSTVLGTVAFQPTRGEAKSVLFVKRRAYEGREVQSLEGLFGLYDAKTTGQVETGLRRVTMNFNFFVALKSGQIGWRYTGSVPVRAKTVDPRLPVPASGENDWQGMIPFDQMPHVWNPKGGLIANWNNKPVSWWPNLDTPVWGSIFRNRILVDELTKGKLGAEDAEKAIFAIARKAETFPYFSSFLKDIPEFAGYDGSLLEGSANSLLYTLFEDKLRSLVFTPVTGGFASPSNFRLVAGNSVLYRAIQGKTKINYLEGRNGTELIKQAFAQAQAELKDRKFVAGTIPVPGQPGIPYRDRGTYIQVIELGDTVKGRNVLPPGVAERGPHAVSQSQLSRDWQYKAMILK